MSKKIMYVDLFSGAGGFSLGFEMTGNFEPILAIDNNKAAAETYKANFPRTIVIAEDIKSISSRFIADTVGEEVDLVIGSPPCEPFTGANPRRQKNPVDRLYTDPMGQLTLHFIRIVGYLRPRVFVMENVPAIMEDGLREALIYEFRRAGYERVFFNLLRAEDYGTPSRRRRVFISNIPISPPKIRKRVRVIDALWGLPPPGEGWIPNHDPPPPLSNRKMKRAGKLGWGDAMIYYQGAERYLPNLVKLNPFDIAPTVLGSSRFIHPFENRLLTVREQARLMGFPDSFVFYGGRDEAYNMVGEAVPPPLAEAIAREVYMYLTGEVKTPG